jgi:hypothetical protein
MYHSTVAAMPVQFSELPSSDTNVSVSLADMSSLLPTTKPLGVFAVAVPQSADVQPPSIEPPAPPKKPLSPYMTFSKEVSSLEYHGKL